MLNSRIVQWAINQFPDGISQLVVMYLEIFEILQTDFRSDAIGLFAPLFVCVVIRIKLTVLGTFSQSACKESHPKPSLAVIYVYARKSRAVCAHRVVVARLVHRRFPTFSF